MRSITLGLFACLLAGILPMACVDPIEKTLVQRVNVIVVESLITNLDEPQFVYLNRSKSDSLTGRFGTLPLSKVTVQVVVDSSRVFTFQETQSGRYQAPNSFKGEVGHTYQLRLNLPDGTHYQSSVEVMASVPSIDRVYARFNPTSLPAQSINGSTNLYRGAHEVFIDWQDPVNEHNYYRFDWKLFERQDWCHTCVQGFYLKYNPYDDKDSQPYEKCFDSNPFTTSTSGSYYVNDYQCRTQCWEIIPSVSIDVFDDRLSNGGTIKGRRVAQIPFYDSNGALVEIRQESLSQKAYSFFNLFAQQTQNTGGLADTPPSALVGNVHNVANWSEPVVGYFTISAVSRTRYWLDRKDVSGPSPGLFQALNGRLPSAEGEVDPNTNLSKPVYNAPGLLNSSRVPTAVCVPSDSRTPGKPEGWQD